MTTLSAIANSALTALNSYTVAINVTNTNVCNAETEGYTRQKAVLQTTDSGSVDVATVKRIYSSFLTNRLRVETQDLGFYEAQQEVLDAVEVIFNESGTAGLSSVLSDFWNSWSDLVSEPSDSSLRSILASAAETLTDTFNTMSSDLSDIQNAIDDTVVDTVDTVNQLVERIAALNQNIIQAESTGQDSNTYRDSLESLVTELSSLIGVNTYTDDTGQINITLENGKPLVDGTAVWTLSVEMNATTNLQDITWVSTSGVATVITDEISTGKLGGYLEVREDLIPSCLDELDALAASIIAEVNTLHESGYNPDGETGVGFFTGTRASDIAVNADILADTNKIAASATLDSLPDDGSLASAICDLQNTLLLDGGTSTFSDYYAALVGEVGSKVSAVALKYDAQTSVVAACQNQVDSVSSVSTDEELINLTLYQNAYEAAASIMSVIDEMMQTIINM